MNPLSGVLGEAWDLYKRHLAHFLTISFAVYLVIAILTALAVAVFTQTLAGGIVALVLAMIFSIVGAYLVQAALVRAVEDVRDGRADLDVASTMRSVTGRLAPLIGASLLAGLGIGLGFILLIIPGLILLTIWSMIVPVIVLENRGALESFGRSQNLVKGYGMNVFAVILLTWLVLFVAGIILGIVLAPLPDGIEAFISNVVSGGLTAPFIAAAWTLTYYRLRETKEGGSVTTTPAVAAGGPAAPPPAQPVSGGYTGTTGGYTGTTGTPSGGYGGSSAPPPAIPPQQPTAPPDDQAPPPA